MCILSLYHYYTNITWFDKHYYSNYKHAKSKLIFKLTVAQGKKMIAEHTAKE